jgi:hypothetical protein
MRTTLRNWIVGLGCLLWVTLGWAEEPYRHVETGIELPDLIAGLKRGMPQSYQAKPEEAGVAIPYESDDVEVTVFIRHVDPKSPTTAAEVVSESLAMVKELEKSGTFQDVKIFKGAEGTDVPGWAKGGFIARADGRPIVSLTYATIKGDYVLKVRLSTPNPKSEAITKFIGDLQKVVNEAHPKAGSY